MIGLSRRDFVRMVVAGSLSVHLRAVLAASENSEERAANEKWYPLALEAYIYGFPLAYFGRYRHRQTTDATFMGGAVNRVGQWRHRNRPVVPGVPGAPQVDTLYSNLYADLSREPLLITVPPSDGRYWCIQCCDFFGTTFAVPSRRNIPRSGGLIALVGPTWKGTLPKEVTMTCRAAMPWTFNLMRVHLTSDTDRDNAIRYQLGFRTISLSALLAGEKPGGETGVIENGKALSEGWQPPATSLVVPIAREADPLADFKLLQTMWKECPPPAEDATYIARFAPLGLGTGHSGFDHLAAPIQAALARAAADGLKQIIVTTKPMPGSVTANGWTLPRPTIGLFHDKDYLYRAATAQIGTVATPISENIYMQLTTSPDGKMLSGERRYELRYDAGQLPEAHAFWSLHAYTYEGYTLIENSLKRYAIQSRTPGLTYGTDGSLTIYVQATDPGEDKRSNWLPVAPGKTFFLLTRAYEPHGEMLALRWAGPRCYIAA